MTPGHRFRLHRTGRPRNRPCRGKTRARDEYSIVQDGIRTEVTHLNGGTDGVDVIGDAEILRFADGDVIL
ncbi:hypothetical protein SAMN04488012_1273 [Palleronia salina]|uniref:Uncharacterized protein n=1 Tax=Palleronia salina TaxID=313368 RepID=A0A1M6MEU8_9RHOB|nr:hypothetical protein SAMN04488012_1273 [Palleronia salina]